MLELCKNVNGNVPSESATTLTLGKYNVCYREKIPNISGDRLVLKLHILEGMGSNLGYPEGLVFSHHLRVKCFNVLKRASTSFFSIYDLKFHLYFSHPTTHGYWQLMSFTVTSASRQFVWPTHPPMH
jgi:hypothetical protein